MTKYLYYGLAFLTSVLCAAFGGGPAVVGLFIGITLYHIGTEILD